MHIHSQANCHQRELCSKVASHDNVLNSTYAYKVRTTVRTLRALGLPQVQRATARSVQVYAARKPNTVTDKQPAHNVGSAQQALQLYSEASTNKVPVVNLSLETFELCISSYIRSKSRATTAYDILYALRHTHPTGSHLKPGAFFSLAATPPSAFTKQSLNSNLFLSSSLSPYEQFEVLCAWTGWQIESNEDRSDRMGLVTQGLKRRQRAHDEAHQLLASGTKGRMVKGGGVRTEAGVIGNLESLVLLHAQWQSPLDIRRSMPEQVPVSWPAFTQLMQACERGILANDLMYRSLESQRLKDGTLKYLLKAWLEDASAPLHGKLLEAADLAGWDQGPGNMKGHAAGEANGQGWLPARIKLLSAACNERRKADANGRMQMPALWG